ncbi:TM2 domain-containing protein [Cryobacterium sandaracinum]|uniref:TM2 domain-containing protein n=1 Tax=Cryobacterium sandaracinum TaxID=1259247 RepID=A0ABY2JF35_9MICO|nr:TM2 domain-containing protein [Cryobacterium sandaracinum]TFD02421.1 TM2 domain-containing protein [Cryobacterium sandaracinum]
MPEGSKSFIVTLLLSFFLGVFGADRFYLGKTGSAVLKLVTVGGFGYWMIIDLLITLFGGQRDVGGFRLAGYDKHRKTAWIVIAAVFGSAVLISIGAVTLAAAVDSGGPTSFGWVLLAILAAVGIVAGSIWMLHRRRAHGAAAKEPRAVDSLPPLVRERIAKLQTLRQLYLMHAAAGDRVAPSLIGQIDSVIVNVTELFRRLSLPTDKVQRALAQAEYVDKLGKLAEALDRDYLLDVLANPRLWDNPEQHIRGVAVMFDAVDAQLLDNIRQVNGRRGLKFQVAIDGLMDPRKAMDDRQRDLGSASGAE